MNCLWCDQEIVIKLHWKNVFVPDLQRQICSTCEQHLRVITGPICERCGRSFREKICSDCHLWSQQYNQDPLEKNVAIFMYNDFLKEVITLWKYRGDYVLVNLFKFYFRECFLKHYKPIIKDAVIVPIPLSEERLLERRFNQAEALANLLNNRGIHINSLLVRKHSEKQSKKTRTERIHSINPFVALTTIRKPVILIDDLYTTGTTLRHAAKTLRLRGCPAVYSFTLARS